MPPRSRQTGSRASFKSRLRSYVSPATSGEAAPDGALATSGAAITHLIQDQLTQERSLKDSLEARAGVIIASAGTLVTLLLALVTLLSKSERSFFPVVSRSLISAAIAGFIIAAAFAILAIRPREYAVVDEQSLREMASNQAYNTPASVGEPKIALALVRLIEQTRLGNKKKARFLMWSVLAEMVAIVFLGLAIAATFA
jgi:hypothetical protein